MTWSMMYGLWYCISYRCDSIESYKNSSKCMVANFKNLISVTETHEPTHSIGDRPSRGDRTSKHGKSSTETELMVSNKSRNSRSTKVRSNTHASKTTTDIDQPTLHDQLLTSDDESHRKLSSRRNSSAHHPLITNGNASHGKFTKLDAADLIERLSNNRVPSFLSVDADDMNEELKVNRKVEKEAKISASRGIIRENDGINNNYVVI